MVFFENLKRITTVLGMFGICPFSPDAATKRIHRNRCKTLYTALHFALLLVVLTILNYRTLFYDIKANILHTSCVDDIAEKVCLITASYVHSAISLIALYNRERHIKLLNSLLLANDKFLILTKFYYVKSDGDLHLYLYFGSTFAISLAIGMFCWSGNRTTVVASATFSCMMAIQITTINAQAIYFMYLAKCIGRRVDKLQIELATGLASDLTEIIHYLKLSAVIELMDDYNGIRTLYNETFGTQLLVNSIIDFSVPTTAVFRVLYNINVQGLSVFFVYFFISFVLPVMVKAVFLAKVLQTFGNQVSSLVV